MRCISEIVRALLLIWFVTGFSYVTTKAQIIYHDVDPDFTIPPDSTSPYYLDLNADGIFDYTFDIQAGSNWTDVSFYGGDYWFGNIDNEATSGEPLNAGQMISDSNGWTISAWLAGYDNYGWGSWYDAANKYLGLRILSGGNYYYGWARLDVITNGNSFVIRDFAYQLQANTAIAAGDTGCTHSTTTPAISQLPNESLVSSVTDGNQWYLNGNVIPGETNDTIIVDQTGAYSTRVTDSTGCITSSLAFDFADCDSVHAAIQRSDDTSSTICSGESAFLQFDKKLPSNFQLQWYKNNLPIAGATSIYYYDFQVATSSIYFTVIENAVTSCVDTSEIFSLNVLSLPVTPIITQVHDTLSVDSIYSTYQWKKGSNPLIISGATNPMYVFQYSNYYSIKVTDANECSSSSNNIFYNKCGYYQPNITLYGSNQICEGDSVMLSVNGYENCNYSWIWNNGYNSFYLNDYDTSTFAHENGTYNCSIHDTIYTCSWSPSVAINVSDPNPPIIIVSSDSLVSSPSSFYQWFLNGNEIPGATSQSFHPDTTGYYTVKITNLFGCTAISDAIYHEEIPTAIAETNMNDLQNEKWLGGDFTVFNVFGEEIFSAIVDSVPFQVSLESFPAGIYYIAIRKENIFSVFKALNVK